MKQAFFGVLLLCLPVLAARAEAAPETGADFESGGKLQARVAYWLKVFTERGAVAGRPEIGAAVRAGAREQWREGLQRAGRYLPPTEALFAKEGLPLELSKLPLVLSGFDPAFRGSGEAVGLWAMTADFARRYLVIDEARDERRDPAAATQAAALFFKEAYGRLRSWPLAVTAFGGDLGRFRRALDRWRVYDLGELLAAAPHPPVGFEEGNRYAQLLAALQVYKDVRKYFPALRPEAPAAAIDLRLSHAFAAGYLCRKLALEKEVLMALNPALTQAVWEGRLAVPEGYRLHLPPESADRVKLLRAPELVGPTASLVYGGAVYRVREGDTALSIAKKYGISIKQLEAWNDMRAGELAPGRDLIVREFAAPGYKASVEPLSARQPEPMPLPSEAPRPLPGVKAEVVAAPPVLSRAAVGNADPAVQPDPPAAVPSARSEPEAPARTSRSIPYQVRSGDSLWSIGREFGVSVEKLRQANNMAHPRVNPGQVIAIPAQ